MSMFVRVSLVFAAFFCLSQSAFSASDTACHASAIRSLQKLSPDGYAVYRAMTDKTQFMTWITCEDIQLDLATAVHESVHTLTEEQDAYPLIGGGSIARPHATEQFMPPKEIAGQMAKKFKDPLFIDTYLKPGSATSSDNFMFLLDELNAFSHDLNAATKLTSVHTGNSRPDHRDGLAAMMAFVTAYAEDARKNNPETWKGMNEPNTAKVINTLWKQAETVMAASCGIPDFGTNDREYLGYVCNNGNAAALGDILHHAPSCPARCLSSPITASAR
ncbi:hypothetical protein C7477_1162 [Phyllobacterium leguminum]|uniref:Uncharacterized protein n=2 Tax=Phyllobacterium leguminum TaxID=314237 RepID=A0A318T318_9HYPH|nr:hypothetical protein C7477_1162 [Phyllobacterium leguminum]